MSLSRKVNPGSKCAHVLIKDGYRLTDILIFEAYEENQYSVMHCICRGVARIFQRGGHTVPKRGYSPDFHVILVATAHARVATMLSV